MIRTEMRTRHPDQRIHRWRVYLILWRLHRWAGLGFGALIVLLSATGALLVMHHDLERWLYPEKHVVAPPADPAVRAPVAPILRELQERAPDGFRPLRIDPGHGPTDTDKYLFVSADRATRWAAYLDPYTAAVRWSGPDQALFTPWVLHLHMHLRLGKWGYVVTGAAGAVLALLGVSGLWITRERLRALLRHPFRRRLGARVAFADLHKWIGLVTLYFSLVLGGTGLWFAILIVPNQFKTVPPSPAQALALENLAPVEPAIAATLSHFPDSELARVIFPADARSALQIRVLHRSAAIWEKFSRVDFDPVTGNQLQVHDARTASTAAKWRAILAPLHFGFYGAPWVKWLYVVGGLAPAFLAITGSLIWWLRTRATRAGARHGRPPSAANAGREAQAAR